MLQKRHGLLLVYLTLLCAALLCGCGAGNPLVSAVSAPEPTAALGTGGDGPL